MLGYTRSRVLVAAIVPATAAYALALACTFELPRPGADEMDATSTNDVDARAASEPLDGSVDGAVHEPDVGSTEGGSPGTDWTAVGEAYRSAILADMPIAYWRLGDKVGSLLAKNEIGADYTASTAGCQLGVPGIFGPTGDTAFALHQATIPVDSDAGLATLDFPGFAPFTFELWLQADDLSGNVFDNVNALDPHAAGTFLGFRAGHLRSERWSEHKVWMYAVTPKASDPTEVTVGRFHHLALVFTGADMRIYIDGQAGEGGLVKPTPDGGMNSNSFPFTWGRLNGVIDEIAVYDKALSAVQLAKHIAAARPR